METKTLLTVSPAVAGAIQSIQQAVQEGHALVQAEITTLKANVVAIKSASASYLGSINADIQRLKSLEKSDPTTIAADKAAIAADKLKLKLVVRDEKFAIGEQQAAIKAAQKVSKDVDSAAKYEIKLVKTGKVDPADVEGDIEFETGVINDRLTAIDDTASANLDGLINTFDSGNP